MANLGDDISKNTLIGMILGLPVFAGIIILALPFMAISYITGMPMGILIQNLLAFGIAVFIIWLFSKYQIIENVIVGLIVGLLVYKYFKWHSLACILIGVITVGLLFLISYKKVGFWIKTILFSTVITFLVYGCFYSSVGLLPLSDVIWKIAFCVVFFLENIFIRCTAINNRIFLISKSRDSKTEERYNHEKNQTGLETNSFGNIENQINFSSCPENSDTEKLNAEITKEQEDEDSAGYLMDRVYLFAQRKSFWDGKIEDNIEKKVYQELKLFIDDAYIIIPHVAFREIFWWGDWWSDSKLTNRVTKMHYDFGIYNKEMQPILFIEIQGKEHKENPIVIERDKFKAEVMKHCGMKLITIDCSEPMTDYEIREKVVACIKKEIPDRKSYAVYCPNCKSHGKNSLMVIKRNKSDGTFFYGCSTYEEGKPDKCPTLNLDNVPPLYYGIPLFKE